MYHPLLTVFLAARPSRCYKYKSGSASMKNAGEKNILAKPSLWKHMLEHLPAVTEALDVPLVQLSECNFDQILGQLQELIRNRGGHDKHAIVTALQHMADDTTNEEQFAIRRTERSAGNSREREEQKRLGQLAVRTLVFDGALASQLPFEVLEEQLATHDLSGHLSTRSLDGGSLSILSEHKHEARHINASRRALKTAYMNGEIWFFCMCTGPDPHLGHCTPCLMST
jgi:hypothetical protein